MQHGNSMGAAREQHGREQHGSSMARTEQHGSSMGENSMGAAWAEAAWAEAAWAEAWAEAAREKHGRKQHGRKQHGDLTIHTASFLSDLRCMQQHTPYSSEAAAASTVSAEAAFLSIGRMGDRRDRGLKPQFYG